MKRIAIALAAVAVAAVAAVGVVRVTGDSSPAPRPSTSRENQLQDLKDQGIKQAKQQKAARDQMRREVAKYAKRHKPVTTP